MNARKSGLMEGYITPPQEWLIEHFVTDGQVTFCPTCRSVPLLALAGGCACGLDRTLASIHKLMTPWVTEPVDPERLLAVQSEDDPDSWSCSYQPPVIDHQNAR